MKTFDYYIGIDPDIEASGFALLDRRKARLVDVQTLAFPLLIDRLCQMREGRASIAVVVEASWMQTTNWHILQRYGSTARAAAVGRAVGLNHATGMHIAAMARAYGFTVIEQRPLRKIGHGKDGKLTHADAAYYMQGLPARTNQEERDAARLAWVVAGLQEIMKAI
jgi:hypothetical protein